MTSTTGSVMQASAPRPGERHEWTLLPLTLIAYGAGALWLLSLAAQVLTFPSSIGSTGPVLLDLHATFRLPTAAGTHHFFGSAYIADGVTITGTGARAEVTGIGPLSRVLLHLAPLLWSATICIAATTIGATLSRLRHRDPTRPASRPLQIAAFALALGSTIAQIANAIALTQIGYVAWDGRDGIDGFTATPDTLFDITPIAIAVALLAIVLLIRRTEPTPAPVESESGRVATGRGASEGDRT